MVAAVAAGPRPISHGTLDAQRLVKAIQYCLTARAVKAAHHISARIKRETGVKAAVAPFHRHLLQDLLPNLPAARKCRKGGKQYRTCRAQLQGKRSSQGYGAGHNASFPEACTNYLPGTLVDVALAAAEGFRVLPVSYRGKEHKYDQVADWKAGLRTGAKCFAIWMAESMGDVFYQPYKGARDGRHTEYSGGYLGLQRKSATPR
ncbi:uncharacterized protein CDV56_106411 [Aspergillus thermomutatus]|uniref:Uncharacterized protein n=1 Tax=Aspergillus thermomutatus TaxID=41047 RepID=A0A397GXY3_ASPTH|nr:uncharacterized protein CDV56_106411 [Aspergillus thermomutatus]RHZ53923.1 hypothetical protein CDV56_106411 [Aspergillus thermomutatus]